MVFRVTYSRRSAWTILLLLGSFILLASALQKIESPVLPLLDYDSGYETENQHAFRPHRPTFPEQSPADFDQTSADLDTSDGNQRLDASAVANVLQELHNALDTMQQEYFSLWLGKWTTAIDWTAAVIGTHLSAALFSLSHSLSYTMPGTFNKRNKLDVEAQMVENEINKYFSQSITYFFGEDHFAIRNQAYDDMLWVVLGWLESIQFITTHSERHYPLSSGPSNGESEWHGKQFTPAFAHRARIFYELASKGWDWKLCGGGMNWNPHTKLPYKNAITNELFISASIGMYLHFPGDTNCSPFMGGMDSGAHPNYTALGLDGNGDASACPSFTPKATYDPVYLQAAINGYDWLKGSNMTNEQGLYVDGFHITDYGHNGSIGTGKCDERNEMVYTYNQGVLLSGLHSLWEGTGKLFYLEDGHRLIRNVIRATGWKDSLLPTISFSATPKNRQSYRRQQRRPLDTTTTTLKRQEQTNPPLDWSGLGAHGILSEACDPFGTCSQNGQTFKSIFMHHLTRFCSPLPTTAASPGHTYSASREIAALHRRSCNEYAAWVVHNAHSALKNRDKKGRFGGWWGAHEYDEDGKVPDKRDAQRVIPVNATDYRNSLDGDPAGEVEIRGIVGANGDLNDRGRGRTVETQGGGVAVVRAMWEFLRWYDDGDVW
ncbi:glycoside hydrolase family 76 protein [Zopfia rhizophila CBS 207.26]|uniref:Glycoside hydrolase family 76 protein n=1 Tax=Zopfia rhizophila CBS 207.26 TaxID=1314779 RepID=A0A6A6E5T2_9PEZI|nr:glycoside hydrolase family 76 protein [Zopfia rhizophila CBS 207.26]